MGGGRNKLKILLPYANIETKEATHICFLYAFMLTRYLLFLSPFVQLS